MNSSLLYQGDCYTTVTTQAVLIALICFWAIYLLKKPPQSSFKGLYLQFLYFTLQCDRLLLSYKSISITHFYFNLHLCIIELDIIRYFPLDLIPVKPFAYARGFFPSQLSEDTSLFQQSLRILFLQHQTLHCKRNYLTRLLYLM